MTLPSIRLRRGAPAVEPQHGFSLVELAIVLIIVALLSGGMLVSLTTSRDIALAGDTQRQLGIINDALLGFAAANGRLPCPASDTSNGAESFCTQDASEPGSCTKTTTPQDHGRCSNPFDGFLPAKTLGVTPTDTLGYAVDPWNNQIRYGVSTAFVGTNYVFTGPGKIRAAWGTPPLPDATKLLRVCSTAAGASGGGATADCQNAASTVADHAVAIIFSRGPNGSAAPTSADEIENGDNDRMFISVTNSPTFDDSVSWLSPNLLYNRMISSGRLP